MTNIIPISDIKKEVIELFSKINKKKLLEDSYKSITYNTDLTSVIFPLHYLFDSSLNENIGNTSTNVDIIREKLKLDELFDLIKDNIKSIPHPSHSTKMYKFKYKDKNYIYYSNSGFGAENHIIDDSNNTNSPKLYYCAEEIYIDNIINYIVTFLDKINNVKSISFTPGLYTNEPQIQTFCLDINDQKIKDINININLDIFTKLCRFIEDDKENRARNVQNLVYALLNYIIYLSYDPSKPAIIQEVSFNHLIDENDNIDFINNINRLSKTLDGEDVSDKSKTLLYFLNNCIIQDKDGYTYNQKINRKIYELGQNSNYQSKLNINNFIDTINEELRKSTEYTINYKLKDFRLGYNNLYGITNSLQKSGSCTFYSYYNLAINMLILKLLDTQDVNDFINKFNYFHYLMIYLFALSLDTEFIPTSINSFNANSLYKYNYIYDIIKKNDLIDEIMTFYNKDTFIYKNYNKLLLNLSLDGSLSKSRSMKEYNISDIHKEFNTYIYDILHKIRNNNLQDTFDKIKKALDTITKSIADSLSKNNDFIELTKLANLARDKDEVLKDFIIYYKTISEIYFIYLVILINIYKENIKIIESKYRFSYIYFCNMFQGSDSEKEDKVCIDRSKYTGNFYYTELFKEFNLLFLKLNRDEIINISSFIYDRKNINSVIDSLSISDKITMCKYIDIHIDFYNIDTNHIYITYPTFIYPLDKSHDEYKLIHGLRFSYDTYFYTIFTDVVKCYDIINDINCSEEIKNKYIVIKNNIIKNFRLNFKNYINDKSVFVRYEITLNITFNLISLILTDFKYCFLVNTSLFNYYYKIVYLLSNIRSNTRLFSSDKNILTTDNLYVFYPMFNNPELFESEYFVNCFINTQNKIKWINDLNITFTSDSDVFYFYKKEYISLKHIHGYVSGYNGYTPSSNRLLLLLSRFGYSVNDQNKYLFLVNKDSLTNLKSSKDTYEINPNSNGKILILCNTYHRCIELNFNNNKIDLNECYIVDNLGKYKIILDYDIIKYPFFKLIPETSPYLLYEQNNTYYVDVLLTDGFNCDQKLQKYSITFQKDNKKNNNDEYLYQLYKFKISPSLLFPNISTFNFDLNKVLMDMYGYENYSLSKYKSNYIDFIKDDFDTFVINITEITDLLKKFIQFDYDNVALFKQSINTILEKDPTYDYKPSIDSFLAEYRLCSSSGKKCGDVNIGDICKDLLKSLEIMLDESKKSIEQKKYIDEYIITNFNTFIKIMIINILINILKSQISVTDISCWDVQSILIILSNINNFIHKIKTDYFYFYELLFMLQNDYIYSRSQLDKYKEIQKELIDENKELKLHQFMMGKGKTSVFTPLLAFSIKLLKQKEPLIITASHLVKDTKQFMLLTEQLLSSNDNQITINVLSDFDAKKRWIENTDISFKVGRKDDRIDLKNEYNIIDEFDSHHNYLQSMFNYVIEEEKFITDDIMYYIYLYIVNKLKLNGVSVSVDITNKMTNIADNNIFNRHLDSSFDSTTNMIYNKDYGLEAITLNNFNINILCSPFARKDTPIVGSNFSNLLLRLILTFKTYMINFNMKLTDFDFEYMEKNNKIIMELINIIEFLNNINNVYIQNNLKIKENKDKLKLL